MKTEPIREAHSFVCLRCGHSWEGEYEIRHARDADGCLYAEHYVKHGIKVPSPLTENVCRVCLGRKIRILRPGRVRAAHPAPL
ncbi:hypothetical protein [Streptomyces sp. HUAS TT20]|uniref:hypothetical protein n=1 Tax=Streptomyces sp. HUAS TT20 TaxID=3447509 RepID=UPI0021DB41A3|nr:hypothetical protein [Streptomyces sp. HUAS 15-9]UXY25291.1 hypothetical protein N8I87_01040 [Streptomyces sp. HUAS 15-9]